MFSTAFCKLICLSSIKFKIIVRMLLGLECLYWANTRNDSYFWVFDAYDIPSLSGSICPAGWKKEFIYSTNTYWTISVCQAVFSVCLNEMRQWTKQTPCFHGAFKKLPNILSKRMGEGRCREVDSLSGVLENPLQDGRQTQDENGRVGIWFGEWEQS